MDFTIECIHKGLQYVGLFSYAHTEKMMGCHLFFFLSSFVVLIFKALTSLGKNKFNISSKILFLH